MLRNYSYVIIMSRKIIDVMIRKGQPKKDKSNEYWPDQYYVSISPYVPEDGSYVGPNFGQSYMVHPDIVQDLMDLYGCKKFYELVGRELQDKYNAIIMTPYGKMSVIGNILLKK